MNVEERPSLRTENAQKPVVTREVGDGESVTSAVVAAVRSTADRDPRELPPLYDAIDSDALEDIFGAMPDGTERRLDGRVVFQYGDYEVCVESGGTVRVYR
ncbi:HalOD1 output domain-containing protein [Halorussus salinus]|uniref:HalOD1 output domain-containing protein n=1 Tax=Halorussus salinus TaxID=1364935 RepID=UPI00138EEE06|nr:HalOD1 output domain-containing protein [Halorussus salinus]